MLADGFFQDFKALIEKGRKMKQDAIARHLGGYGSKTQCVQKQTKKTIAIRQRPVLSLVVFK